MPDPERKSSAQFAITSTEMEGGTVSQETEILLEKWAGGSVSDDELIEQTLKKFTPASAKKTRR